MCGWESGSTGTLRWKGGSGTTIRYDGYVCMYVRKRSIQLHYFTDISFRMHPIRPNIPTKPEGGRF